MAKNSTLGKTLMPVCVGQFLRDDPECNGDPKGETDEARMPCFFRDRCLALDLQCRHIGAKVESLVQITKERGNQYAVARGSDGELQRLMTEGVRRWGIKDGIAQAAPGASARGVRSVALLGLPEGGVAMSRLAPTPVRPGVFNTAGREYVTEVGEHYKRKLVERTGLELAEDQASATLGQMFLVDRRQSSGYISVYVKAPKGRKMALTALYYKPNKGCIDIRVAAPYKEFVTCLSALNRGRLKPTDVTGSDGHFKILFKQVDKAGSAIVAEAIAVAAKSGIVVLPPGA